MPLNIRIVGEIFLSGITGEAETVLLEVEDHGRGISKESMEHLFERFYTGNKTFGTVGFGIGTQSFKRVCRPA